MPLATFESFKSVGGKSLPTWEMTLPDGKVLQIAKLEEDPEQGYEYTLSRISNDKVEHITTAFFDGFGFDDRAGDVIHTVRLYIAQNY